ncbi:MAG: hypothetical protein K2P12_03835 [Clostridia bacterium]|nr:hypothetical protein [Clostridia bacterium]
MNKAKLKFNFSVVVLLAIIFLLCSSIISTFISPSKAIALTESGINNAYKVGNSEELWNSDTNSFNETVVNDLKQQLFGNKNPLTYINEKYDKNEYTLTGSKIVTALTINPQVGKKEEGMVVKLGGMDWMVTSLTTTNDGKEDIVVTLYLANPSDKAEDKVQFWNKASTAADDPKYKYGKKGENMYSSSILREHLLTSDKWSMFSGGYFANNFLVQPTKIQYQHTQSAFHRWEEKYAYHWPNEALDTQKDGDGVTSGKWHEYLKYGGQTPYKAGDVFNDKSGNPQSYEAWGKDYIWIPSMTEAGGNNGYMKERSIWKITPTQKMFWNGTSTDVAHCSWLRSGSLCYYYDAYALGATGAFVANTLARRSFGVRPAIHLNLSAMEKLAEPENLKTTFNEKEHTIKSLATEYKSTWYNKDIYEHADNFINITYPKNEAYIKNAGEYWVQIEITSQYIDFVNAQIEKKGAEYGWTADEIAQMQEKSKPKFLGEADKSDNDHPESDTVRWIKVTIDPAVIDFSKLVWGADKLQYNGEKQSIEIESGFPNGITFEYKNNEQIAFGKYTAEVTKINSSNPNYKSIEITNINDYPALKHDWEITKKEISASWTNLGKTQNGITIYFPVLDLEEYLKDSVEYAYYRDSSVTQIISEADIFAEFDEEILQTYYAKATLRSSGGLFNATNSKFVKDGKEVDYLQAAMDTGLAEGSVRVVINKSKFTFNNQVQQASFFVIGEGVTERDLKLTYYDNKGTLLETAPKNVGKYKVKVELNENLTDFVLVGKTEFEFEIESLKIKKPNQSQTQFFRADGFSLSDIANLPDDWKTYFTIKAYDKDNNEIVHANNNWEFVNVNNYRIEISFKSGINTASGGSADNVIWSDSDKNTFEVALEIKPLVFDIEGWKDSTGNKKPVITGADSTEIAKYFDYEIYELRNGVIVGNMLPYDATLKYNTDYQITLKVKDEFSGNVFLEYNGEQISETETHKFKTDIDPNASGGDNGEDNDSEGIFGGLGGGTEAWFGTNGKLPLFAWVLVGIIVLLILVMIILLITRCNKKQPVAQQPIVYVQNDNPQATEVVKEVEKINVRGTIVNNYKVGNKDWTFVVKDTDILNLKELEYPQEEIMFYAFKKNDLKKIKKFEKQIEEAESKANSNNTPNGKDLNASNSKSKKHKR